MHTPYVQRKPQTLSKTTAPGTGLPGQAGRDPTRFPGCLGVTLRLSLRPRLGGTMTGRATVKDLRQRNRAAVLRRIVLAGETTRAKVAADCALSSATVTNVVSDLMREGLVEENGSLPSDGGRPIARLRAAAGAAHLIGADVGEHGVTVELFDLSLSRVD